MLVKILLTIGLLTVAWVVFFRGQRGRNRVTHKRRRNPLTEQTLVKCPNCGIYMQKDAHCGCRDGAT